MKQSVFTVRDNKKIARDVYKMVLNGDTGDILRPGQFVNIKLAGRFLRRPISVCDRNEKELTVIYKVIGDGTDQMRKLGAGSELDILTGLGNGYDLTVSGSTPLLVGGGVGVPPLYWLCRELEAQGKHVKVILGFNASDEVFYEDEFRSSGADVTVMTADGTYGNKGFVTDGMAQLDTYTYIYACGPMPMFRAINKIAQTEGQFSFEERMGCGFGACMGCSCKTLTGNRRICKDGPVLLRSEVIWDS